MNAPLAFVVAVCVIGLAVVPSRRSHGGKGPDVGAPDAGAPDAGASDAEAIRGRWACVSAVVDGKPLPEETVKKLTLTLTRDRYRTERAGRVLFDSTYRLDPARRPKRIEMIGTEGDAEGKPALGIYALERGPGKSDSGQGDGDKTDTLKICYTMPGGERPKGFASAAGSGAYLVTWKRLGAVDP